ncbi:MAG: LuxR C-terminal-related transcriptional regulator [Bacteroidota bacterium]
MKWMKGIRSILLYGLIIAILIFGLKWLEWKFLIVDHTIDIYIGLIAIVFTMLGVWVATQLIQTKTQTVIVEKKIIVPQAKEFTVNEPALRRLGLTHREYEVLQLIAEGHSNSDIANQLFLSLSTIKTHASNLYSKMNVKNRYQAITEAKKMEIIE